MSLQEDLEPKMKRAMHNNEREEEEEVDRISNLPDSIILYILKFITTKEAVQTCILSKRWKEIWKYLPTLTARSSHFQKTELCKKFVCKVLKHRDESSALHTISIKHDGYFNSHIWTKLIDYAVSHEVEKFKVHTFLFDDNINMMLLHPMFSLHSLKCLDLSLPKSGWINLSKTLDLPQLEKCCLRHVAFTSSDDNDCAYPFLGCKKLSTLVIENCKLRNGKMLCVSSDKLANLTIKFSMFIFNPFKVGIFAPNLRAFTFEGHLTSSNNYQIFEHNLDSIEEASIEVYCNPSYPEVVETLKNLFKRIRNVHSLRLCLQTLQGISSIPNFPKIESIGFGNLKSLIVKRGPEIQLSDGGVLNYLLQDSPLAEVRIIRDDSLGLECQHMYLGFISLLRNWHVNSLL